MFFAVLNIITGVFVEGAIAKAQTEKEDMLQDQLKDENDMRQELSDLFEAIDTDGSGLIDISEFETMLEKDTTRGLFRVCGLRVSQAWEVFRLLDKDKDYTISRHEFVDGCMKLSGSANSLDIASVINQIEELAVGWSHYRILITKELDEVKELIETNFIPSPISTTSSPTTPHSRRRTPTPHARASKKSLPSGGGRMPRTPRTPRVNAPSRDADSRNDFKVPALKHVFFHRPVAEG